MSPHVDEVKDENESDNRLVSAQSALRLGLVLMFFALLVILGPLFLTYIGSNANIDSIYSSYSVFLLLGMFLLAIGATVVFSLAVRVSAVGAGQFDLFGFKFPIEVQGAVFVFIMLLLAMGFTANYFGLTSLRDNWTELVNLRSDKKSLEDDLKDAKDRENSATSAENSLRRVIVERLSGGSAHRIVIRVACGETDTARAVLWKPGLGSTHTGIVPLGTATAASDNSADGAKELDPVTMAHTSKPTFVIVRPNPDDPRGQPQKVISASLHFEEEVLVATIWPNDVSLNDLCRSPSEHQRFDNSNQGQDHVANTLDAAAEAGANQ